MSTTPPQPPPLDGRNVVVTGASRGIGAALAGRATALGASVAGCAGRSIAEVDLALTSEVDVSDHRAVAAFADSVVAALGTIDLWVNNAAVIDPLGPLRNHTPADVRRILDINVVGVWNGSVAFVRHRRALGGGGTLINITSGAAVAASAGTGLYSASKAAVDRLTEAIALEEANVGTAAWAIQPGVVDTAMQAALRECTPEVLPRVDEFRRLAEADGFNRGRYVADWLLAIAFDADHRPPATIWRLPDERPGTRPGSAGTDPTP